MLAGLPLLLGRLQLLSAACRAGKGHSGKGPRMASKTNKIGLVSTAVCDHPEISTILPRAAGDGLSDFGLVAFGLIRYPTSCSTPLSNHATSRSLSPETAPTGFAESLIRI